MSSFVVPRFMMSKHEKVMYQFDRWIIIFDEAKEDYYLLHCCEEAIEEQKRFNTTYKNPEIIPYIGTQFFNANEACEFCEEKMSDKIVTTMLLLGSNKNESD